MSFGVAKIKIKPFAVPEDLKDNFIEAIRKNIKVSICGCWEWQGRIVNNYPCVSVKGCKSSIWAHRASYATFVGPIAANMHIDHKCRNPICVRPDHLQQLPPRENYLAIYRRKRKDERKKLKEAGQLSLFSDNKWGIDTIFGRNADGTFRK